MTQQTHARTAFDLSTTQAAAYLGVHRDTLMRWVKAGTCRAVKTPTNRYRFSKVDLDELIGEAS